MDRNDGVDQGRGQADGVRKGPGDEEPGSRLTTKAPHF